MAPFGFDLWTICSLWQVSMSKRFDDPSRAACGNSSPGPHGFTWVRTVFTKQVLVKDAKKDKMSLEGWWPTATKSNVMRRELSS